MTCSAIKRKSIAALLTAALLVSFISIFPIRSYADGKNETVAGTDFSLIPSGTVYSRAGASADTETVSDEDGNAIFTLRHPGSSSFTAKGMLILNGANGADPYVSFSAAGLFERGKSYSVDIAARFDHEKPLTSGNELLLVDLVGKNASGGTVSFAPVKLTQSGYISYYNGSSYTESDVYLSKNQWKKISVVFHVSSSGSVRCDVYLLEDLIVRNVASPASFSSFTEIRTLEITGSGCACTAYLDHLKAYEGSEPAYGKYPVCDEDTITAYADFSGIPNGTTVFDALSDEKMRLQPLGNPATVFISGSNPYLSVTRSDYTPYLDVYTSKSVNGKTQVLEAAIKLDKNWSAEAVLLSPFVSDPSGIVLRSGLLTLTADGKLMLPDKKAVAIISTQMTTISVVLRYDRKSYDVYVDGLLCASGVGFDAEGFDDLDGFRAFGFTGTGTGTLTIDYAVMYGDIIPASVKTSDDKLIAENAFNTLENTYPPLTLNGSLIAPERSGNGYRLGYKSEASSKLSSVSIPVNLTGSPLYADYTFSFAALVKNLELISLYKGNDEIIPLATVNTDGWLCVRNGIEYEKCRKLDVNTDYRLTVFLDFDNCYYNIYIGGTPVMSFRSLPENCVADTDKIVMLSTTSDGRTVATLDDLSIYQSSEMLDQSLKTPEFDFRVSMSNDGSVLVKWDGVGTAAGYTVWRSSSEFATPEKITDVIYGQNEYRDFDIEEDKTYYYRVCLTVKRGEKEIYFGEDAEMKSIKVKIPESAYKLDTPDGFLPAYTSKTIINDTFSSADTAVTTYSEYCFVDSVAGVLKVFNPSDSVKIPYFSVDGLSYKHSNIVDFEMKYTREKNNITVAAVYNGFTPVTVIAKLKDNQLLSGDGTKIMTFKENETYRITVWTDLRCANAALFVNGKCVIENLPISEFSPQNNTYSLHFCAVNGENAITVDNLKALETRTFLTSYTEPPLAPLASVSGNTNSVSWTSFKGCEYYTLWQSSTENGTYSILEDALDRTSFYIENVGSTKYYKVTYTFDTLGVELTVPLSGAACAEYIPEGATVIIPFLDFSVPATLPCLILSLAALACVCAVLLPDSIKKSKKETTTEKDPNKIK